MHTRTVGGMLAAAAGVLALHPVGPLERAADLFLIPARLVAPLGAPARVVAAGPSASTGRRAVSQEAALSLRLERAIRASAMPDDEGLIGLDVVPVAGEVDARVGANPDHIAVRVTDPAPIEAGQPVVSGDAYVGTVERVATSRAPAARASLLERIGRRLGLVGPPVAPEPDIVVVRLVTDPEARVGGRVEEDGERPVCRLVVGGLAPRPDRVWLAVHNPESRATRSGLVRVHEPLDVVESYDRLAEGFVLGELAVERLRPRGEVVERDVLGVVPRVDFESGLNQVLVLTDDPFGSGAPSLESDVVPVLEAKGWTPARATSIGDASPWRRTARIDLGRGAGVRAGAAVVDGVRLVGRVARGDRRGASVALLDDPGFRVKVIAQSVQDPDAPPLVLGDLESRGRDADGRIAFEGRPRSDGWPAAWLGRYGSEVRLFTGSGMARVPRGLLLGRSRIVRLPSDEVDAQPVVSVALQDVGDPTAALMVRTAGAHLERGEERRAGVVQAAEVDR